MRVKKSSSSRAEWAALPDHCGTEGGSTSAGRLLLGLELSRENPSELQAQTKTLAARVEICTFTLYTSVYNTGNSYKTNFNAKNERV